MHREPIHIYDRKIDPTHIIAILPYKPPLDPARAIWDDLNSTVLLTRRPHRLAARRDPESLANDLGFYYLPSDRVALNSKWRIDVEPFTARDEMEALRFPGICRVTLHRSGFKHSLMLSTDAETVSSIVHSPPRGSVLLDVLNAHLTSGTAKFNAG